MTIQRLSFNARIVKVDRIAQYIVTIGPDGRYQKVDLRGAELEIEDVGESIVLRATYPNGDEITIEGPK
jgi:hypothetical protein